MIKTITQSDLICYFYGEIDAQTKDYIDNNIDFNPDWVTLLNDLKEFEKEDPYFWKPAELIVKLVEEGKDFNSLN